MLFGFEKSFIFDFSLAGLGSLSGTGGGLSDTPGEYCGLRGNAGPCAVAAAKLCPPMNPSIFLYDWFWVTLKVRWSGTGYRNGGCTGLFGSGSVCDRFLLCWTLCACMAA
jgi:hypothetical protein